MTDSATSTNYYYFADGLGSITQIQDQSKAVVESYIYDSFGNPMIKDAVGTTITQSTIRIYSLAVNMTAKLEFIITGRGIMMRGWGGL